ncbi:hypothetical protein D3C86_2002690 [compost metagenome]
MIAKGDRIVSKLQTLEKYNPVENDLLTVITNNRTTRQAELKQLLTRNHPPSYESLFPTAKSAEKIRK